jgi:uncharacterized RmlC-like cupin family protein
VALKRRVPLQGRYRPRLERWLITEPVDSLFVLPNVPHQPINLSQTPPAPAIVLRNDPDEQERLILHEPSTHD